MLPPFLALALSKAWSAQSLAFELRPGSKEHVIVLAHSAEAIGRLLTPLLQETFSLFDSTSPHEQLEKRLERTELVKAQLLVADPPPQLPAALEEIFHRALMASYPGYPLASEAINSIRKGYAGYSLLLLDGLAATYLYSEAEAALAEFIRLYWLPVHEVLDKSQTSVARIVLFATEMEQCSFLQTDSERVPESEQPDCKRREPSLVTTLDKLGTGVVY